MEAVECTMMGSEKASMGNSVRCHGLWSTCVHCACSHHMMHTVWMCVHACTLVRSLTQECDINFSTTSPLDSFSPPSINRLARLQFTLP